MSNNWLEESTEILRVIINDMSDTPTYNDNTLEQTLLVGAKYVVQEINMDINYSVNFLGGVVTPDPSTDDTFLSLIILKAACLTNQWKFNDIALVNGIKARLGPAEISVDSSSSLLLSLIKDGPCKTYETLKDDINFGRIGAIRAIIGPFRSNKYQSDGPSVGRF